LIKNQEKDIAVENSDLSRPALRRSPKKPRSSDPIWQLRRGTGEKRIGDQKPTS